MKAKQPHHETIFISLYLSAKFNKFSVMFTFLPQTLHVYTGNILNIAFMVFVMFDIPRYL